MQLRVAVSAALLLMIVSVAIAGCASGSPGGVDSGGGVMDTGVPTDTGWVDDILLEQEAPPSTNLCAP